MAGMLSLALMLRSCETLCDASLKYWLDETHGTNARCTFQLQGRGLGLGSSRKGLITFFVLSFYVDPVWPSMAAVIPKLLIVLYCQGPPDLG
jgi:hypothetical protein